MKVAIIGGGAAGFFSAICVKRNYPKAHVTIYEKSQKLLSKVKISGGGRCNVTNGCKNVNDLCKAYPRGGKKLKSAFNIFNTKHIFEWFESRGVPLTIEDDGRVFPKSNSSQSIIDCFMKEVNSLRIDIKTGSGVKEIRAIDNKIKLLFLEEKNKVSLVDKVIIASGGSPTKKGFKWFERSGHIIKDPVPSLFTFNIPKSPIIKLMGVVAKDTLVNIQGTKLSSNGPLLITHWGMSGPAILKLSSFGARILNEMNYDFNIQVS
ncbi:MAG TPA: aminoacetone oxidase family FAD-binding enzyme, partial [Bacteroidetes bacterium]|nr:aminoacetone oxidase family FAD-binding enzyme [Bacteroidota bacterium]